MKIKLSDGKEANIRYVHVQTGHRKTIAYVTDWPNECVVYVWTDLYHKDQYNKEIGRNHTTQRLVDLMQIHLLNNEDKRSGVVHVSTFHESMSHSLTDETVNELKLHNFKHSFISAHLNIIINNRIVKEKNGSSTNSID